MEQTVVLSVDEVSVLIGLLDEGWITHRAERAAELRAMAQRYIDLLWTRVVDVTEGFVANGDAIAENRRLRARHDELVAALRAAAEMVGTDGPLEGRPAADGDLNDLRALLQTVARA
jgi:hypothetical protein